MHHFNRDIPTEMSTAEGRPEGQSGLTPFCSGKTVGPPEEDPSPIASIRALPPFPDRCYTCHTPIGNRLPRYQKLVKRAAATARAGVEAAGTQAPPLQAVVAPEMTALDQMEILSPCCRRHFLTYVGPQVTMRDDGRSSADGRPSYNVPIYRIERYDETGALTVEDWTDRVEEMREKTNFRSEV